jgi:hypothetical protein
MVKKAAIALVFCLFGVASAFGQDKPDPEKPAKQEQKQKEIKNVPAAGSKAKPAKITSSARPKAVKPNQPVQRGKPPAKGKPPGAGKPGGN